MMESKRSSIDDRADLTYRNDILRASFAGILEAGWSIFTLLIAIRYFSAPENYKAFIASAAPIGFLLTPITTYLIAKWRFRPSLVSACVFVLAALLVVGATAIESLFLFTAFMMTSLMITVQQGPLMTQIYAENYLENQRGSRLAIPFTITALSAILFSLAGGRLLDRSMNYYPWLLFIMAFSALASAWATNRIPSTPLSIETVGNPWQNVSLIWKDKLFGYLLGSWMLLGLGNLITIPIRVEYLANPRYNINLDNTAIAFLLVFVPSVARILSTWIFGRLFDNLHFITIRNLLNIFFLLGIVCFFFTKNTIILSVAMIFVGLSTGGGKIVWNLWVTKIALAEKVSAYMSVHMALTGVRGTVAPFLGYWILNKLSPQGVATVGILLVCTSIALFECLRNHTRFRN